MKIFGVSLGRNGTQSLADFLRIQGFSVTHFYDFQNLELGSFAENQNGIVAHFNSLRSTDAYIDIPTCLVFDKMYEKFPDAKFINITRPVDKWVASMKKVQNKLAHSGDPYLFEEAYCNFYAETGKTKIQDLTEEELRFIWSKHTEKIQNFFNNKINYLEVDLEDPEIGQKIRTFVNGLSESPFPWKDDAINNPF